MQVGEETGRKRQQRQAENIAWEEIAERAYLISQSEEGGTDLENWLRAERELQEAVRVVRKPRGKKDGLTNT